MTQQLINLTKLTEETLDTSIEITPTWEWISQQLVNFFLTVPWVQSLTTLSICVMLYIVFRKQPFVSFNNAQLIAASSFCGMVLNVFLLYTQYWVSVVPLGFTTLIWLGAVITLVRK